MKEFDLDLLINKKAVVKCRTEDEAIEFISYLWVNDIKWCDGMSLCSSGAYRYSKFLYETCFALDNMGLSFSDSTFYKKNGYEILCLSDLLMAQEPKPKNNFKEYGFEADFEGEICFKNHNGFYIGYINKPIGKLFKQWRKNDGNCFCMEGYYDRQYNLKPIKKEWYENSDNFPTLVVDNNKKILYVNKYQYTKENNTHWVIYEEMGEEIYSLNLEYYRPATKEEVLALLVKE